MKFIDKYIKNNKKRSFIKSAKIRCYKLRKKHPKLFSFYCIFFFFTSVLSVFLILQMSNLSHNDPVELNQGNNTYNINVDNTHIPAAELEKEKLVASYRKMPSDKQYKDGKGVVLSSEEVEALGGIFDDIFIHQLYFHNKFLIDAYFVDIKKFPKIKTDYLNFIKSYTTNTPTYHDATTNIVYIYSYKPDLYYLRTFENKEEILDYMNNLKPIIRISYIPNKKYIHADVLIDNKYKTFEQSYKNGWVLEESGNSINNTKTEDDEMDDSSMLILIVAGVLVFYFLPSILASVVNNKAKYGIMVLNIFLGWTLLGWVIALVWACCVSDEKEKIIIQEKTQEVEQDYLKEIEKLAELKEKGIITEEEFNTKKSKLLE